jgi:hypothetical protein
MYRGIGRDGAVGKGFDYVAHQGRGGVFLHATVPELKAQMIRSKAGSLVMMLKEYRP